MKTIHIYIFFLLISSFRGITQNKEPFLISPKIGFGQGGNNYQSGATCVQFDLMIHKKLHVFDLIIEKAGHTSHTEYLNNYFSKYKSIDYSFLYGIQLDKNYFSSQISAGIGLIRTFSLQKIECTNNIPSPLPYETCYKNQNYTKPSIPILINITGRLNRFGLFAQALCHFTFPRIDYRYTFGLRIDLYSR